VKLALARAFIEAVVAGDLEAAEESLDPDVETVTPRGTLRGIAACRQVLQKAIGDEQLAMDQTEPSSRRSKARSLPGRMRSLAGVQPTKSRTSATLHSA
jgi:hypothetical protein